MKSRAFIVFASIAGLLSATIYPGLSFAQAVDSATGGTSPPDNAQTDAREDESDLKASVPINHALDAQLLMWAHASGTDKVGKGDAEKIGSLLTQGADPNARDTSGTALQYALNFGKDDAAKLLIRYGADFSIEDQYGENAAWYASMIYYCPGALELMIKKGVDVKGLNIRGATIFSAITSAGPATAGKMNYLHDRVWTPAEYQAYLLRERRVVDLLIQAGADFNGKIGADTPLIRAVKTGHGEAVRALLDHGANPFFKGADGETALSVAQDFHPEFVPILEAAIKKAQAKAGGAPGAP